MPHVSPPTTFAERRADWHQKVSARRSDEALIARALGAARQVAPNFFQAIGRGVITAEARETAFSVAAEAAMEAFVGFRPERGSIEQRAAHFAKRALARAADASVGEFALPRERAEQLRILRSTESDLFSTLGRAPTDEEVLREAKGFTAVILRRTRDAARLLQTIPLDAPVNAGEASESSRMLPMLHDAVPAVEQREITREADIACRRLHERTAVLLDPRTARGRIFRGVNGIGCSCMSQYELAVELGISRQRVGQLLADVTTSLRAVEGLAEIRQAIRDAAPFK